MTSSVEKGSRLSSAMTALVLWYGTYVLAVLLCLKAIDANGMNFIDRAILIVGIMLLLLAFILLHFLLRDALAFAGHAGPPPASTVPIPAGYGAPFPSQGTIGTGIWLLVCSAAAVTGLLWSVSATTGDGGVSADTRNALVMMFAAAVGSLITTVLGYLDHASYKRDFEIAFIPWYVGRPLMGVLLGLIVYFLIKGGLLVVATDASSTSFNQYGLAGVAGLVGLFSRNAVAKLRELFQGLFRTDEDMRTQIINRLPPDLQSAVKAALAAPPPTPKPTPSPIGVPTPGQSR